MKTDTVYFELNSELPGHSYPNAEPFLSWMQNEDDFTFDREEFAKENRLCVVESIIGTSVNFSITAERKWVEEHCPELLTKYKRYLRTRRSESNGLVYGRFGDYFLELAEETIGIHRMTPPKNKRICCCYQFNGLKSYCFKGEDIKGVVIKVLTRAFDRERDEVLFRDNEPGSCTYRYHDIFRVRLDDDVSFLVETNQAAKQFIGEVYGFSEVIPFVYGQELVYEDEKGQNCYLSCTRGELEWFMNKYCAEYRNCEVYARYAKTEFVEVKEDE